LNPLFVDLEVTVIFKMVTATFAETRKGFQQTELLGFKAELILHTPATKA
jgi:hypothetical protein